MLKFVNFLKVVKFLKCFKIKNLKPAEEYIFKQSQEFQEILYYLKTVVEQEFPNVDLLYKWKLPFFYFKGKPVIYFNVNAKKKYVDVGFFYGSKMKKNMEYFIIGNRTVVKLLRYTKIDAIPDAILRAAIREVKALY